MVNSSNYCPLGHCLPTVHASHLLMELMGGDILGFGDGLTYLLYDVLGVGVCKVHDMMRQYFTNGTNIRGDNK